MTEEIDTEEIDVEERILNELVEIRRIAHLIYTVLWSTVMATVR